MASLDIRNNIHELASLLPYSVNKEKNQQFHLLVRVLSDLLDEIEIIKKDLRKFRAETGGRG